MWERNNYPSTLGIIWYLYICASTISPKIRINWKICHIEEIFLFSSQKRSKHTKYMMSGMRAHQILVNVKKENRRLKKSISELEERFEEMGIIVFL